MLDPLPPTSSRLLVKRCGRSITRQIPKPIVLVDTREQAPFDFRAFPNWIADEKRVALPAGDYSIEGMENLIALEESPWMIFWQRSCITVHGSSGNANGWPTTLTAP